jgi:hypothetical protein
MPPRSLSLATMVVALSGVPAVAQTQSPPVALPPHPAPHRLEINPRPPLYRRCVDWYELRHRPSGTVLYPQMRCWWVRG